MIKIMDGANENVGGAEKVGKKVTFANDIALATFRAQACAEGTDCHVDFDMALLESEPIFDQ